MSDFSWWLSGGLYVLGMFVAFAFITSRIQDKIRLYQDRHGEDEFPPEAMWWLLSFVWPVIIFGFLPGLLVEKLGRFFFRVGMGEIDFWRPIRSIRGRFWQVRARIAREEAVDPQA